MRKFMSGSLCIRLGMACAHRRHLILRGAYAPRQAFHEIAVWLRDRGDLQVRLG